MSCSCGSSFHMCSLYTKVADWRCHGRGEEEDRGTSMYNQESFYSTHLLGYCPLYKHFTSKGKMQQEWIHTNWIIQQHIRTWSIKENSTSLCPITTFTIPYFLFKLSLWIWQRKVRQQWSCYRPQWNEKLMQRWKILFWYFFSICISWSSPFAHGPSNPHHWGPFTIPWPINSVAPLW